MAFIMIKCPSDGEPIFTRKTATPAAFEGADYAGSAVRCPSCGAIHAWCKSDAWLEERGPGVLIR